LRYGEVVVFDLRPFSLQVKNFKCFAEEPQGFESILPMNVIVGRNNTGKSSLLDLIEYVTTRRLSITELGHKGQNPEISMDVRLDSNLVNTVFYESENRDRQNAQNSLSQKWFKDSRLHFRIKETNVPQYVGGTLSGGGEIDLRPIEKLKAVFDSRIGNPFPKHAFRRISADRDIRPEKDDHPYSNFTEASLTHNGDGATTIIQRLLTNDRMHDVSIPARLIRDSLLKDLSRIYGLDASFNGIEVFRSGKGGEPGSNWEIFLQEENKGLFPLSQTGSGLKTIILVLLNLIVFPQLVYKRSLDNFIFAFEELENNLHPAIQRRLFLYLREKAVQEGCHFFLTTHSNIIIDLFGQDEKAQILHVTHDGTCAKVETISTYMHKRSVLQDLDIRASDLLQANAVVWVEGPSDRIYFNKWVELWDGELKDGVHFQCLYSGGRLIEGFSFDDPEEVPQPVAAHEPDPEEAFQEFIQALRVNRHAIVMMDRDRGSGERLKPWVPRIIEEVDGTGGVAWVSAGREVENYIPLDLIRTIVAEKGYKMPVEPGQYDRFFECVRGPKGGDLSNRKTQIARWACGLLTVDQIEKTFDLANRLEQVCDKIRSWNGMPLCPHRAPVP
jgi:putative ATP-dependent endonuclease of the OLD family